MLRSVFGGKRKYKAENNIDVVIVNGENSANGDGMLKSSCECLFAAGADFITGGDHTLRRREFYDYLDTSLSVIRPANYGDGTPGRGFGIIDKGAYKVGVINLLGTTWTDGFASPFNAADKIIEQLKKETNIVIIDFHAEATSEKISKKSDSMPAIHTSTNARDVCNIIFFCET